ncbi:MAG: hypothetical protein RSA27_06380 [Oscillospiraceae bacterium]
MLSKIITAILYLILAFVWFMILWASWTIFNFSSLLQHFWNGGLIFVFGFLAILVFVFPFIFRKKLSANWMKPTAMLVLTGVVCLTSCGILNITKIYVSNFNRATWDNNAELRIYMIEDLESEYQLIGKTEQEIKTLIGEPSNISEYKGRTFEYVISSGFMDPITFDIRFKNGVATRCEKIHH